MGFRECVRVIALTLFGYGLLSLCFCAGIWLLPESPVHSGIFGAILFGVGCQAEIRLRTGRFEWFSHGSGSDFYG